MNRCLFSPRFSLHRRVALASIGAVLAWTATPAAFAQLASGVRNFPADAQRAAMVVTQPPEVLLNNLPSRLSPGARIHDSRNLLVQSGALVGNRYLVNYVREFTGLVREVWILTPDEAALTLPTQPARATGTPVDSSPSY